MSQPAEHSYTGHASFERVYQNYAQRLWFTLAKAIDDAFIEGFIYSVYVGRFDNVVTKFNYDEK